jgi:energy-coupling factor transporter ATP-binding protein EcfA2
MSPVEKIVEWTKTKPVWWQHAVRLSLFNGELSQNQLREIYSVGLHEHSLTEDQALFQRAQQTIDTSGYHSEQHEIKLSSLSNVVNVGALAEEQTLQFSPQGLTVVYGDNGAGKSSYAKIFKHACLARGGQPEILGNVIDISLEPSSAVLSVDIAGVSKDKNWDLKSSNDFDLKSIRVFDTDVADHFVSNEDQLGYKPAGLHLLEELALAIDFVKRQIAEETMAQNGLVTLPEFSDTEVGKFITNITHKTEIDDLEKYKPTQKERESIEGLYKEISELKQKTPEQIKRELTDKINLFQPLLDSIEKAVNSLNDKVAGEIKEMHGEYTNKALLAKELRKRLLNDLPIENIGGLSWQVMWGAAEKFFNKNRPESNFPPEEGEDCPLCLQEITALSQQRLLNFKEYLADQTSQDAKLAKENWETKKQVIENTDFNMQAYKAAIAKVDEQIEGFNTSLIELVQVLGERKSVFIMGNVPDEIPVYSPWVLDQLTKYLASIKEQLVNVSDDESLARIIEAKEQLAKLINDKNIYLKNYEHVRNNLLRYKALEKYDQLSLECTPRPVTDLTTEICKAEVIDPLVNAFSEELKKFGFNRFKVEAKTRGSRGAQLMKLQIKDCGESFVGKVASEGEQRCIAIACFLAEIEADKRKSAVIFDDPVNSLSHQWSTRVAKRLVDESLKRQVIVLTHDIVFYKLLHESVECLDDAEIHEVSLERSRKRAGIVRSNPPWDALPTAKRIKHLRNVKLRELKKIDEEGTEREFRNEAYHFYGYLREAWERLVEEKLLNQVVTRFGRGVQTKRLSKLLDLSEDDFRIIDDGMSKCSTYFRGHDSAPAAGDPYPTIDEIEADIESIESFNNELQTTRKRS